MRSPIELKLYSEGKAPLNLAVSNLRRSLKKFSFVRLPVKKSALQICPSVSGRGYSTFKKYENTLNRAVFYISSIRDLNNVVKSLSIRGLYFETKIY